MDLSGEWLDRRTYPQLDPRAERAIRAAGLSFSEGPVAEAHLRAAAEIDADHEAVVIAHYRYYLYKHRYEEAAGYAKRCVARAAASLKLHEDPLRVSSAAWQATANAPERRNWLFAVQAYGYVLLRAGLSEAGSAMLQLLVELDTENESHTAELWSVIQNAGRDDEDD